MKYEDIINEINSLADHEWGNEERHIKIINSKQKILGVRTPELKNLAKKFAKLDLKKSLKLIKFNSFEEITLYGLLLGFVNNFEELLPLIEEFLKRIDNWATCDQTCSALKIFKKDKNNKYYTIFKQYAQSNLEFEARFGIVMIMLYYLNDENIDDIIELTTTIDNHSYYVDMAISWLISVAIIKYENQIFELIKSRKLNKFIQNKAISKCRDSFRVRKEVKDNLVLYRK